MKFISLGGWCGTTMSLRRNSLYKEALPFDHIRSTFIGIIDCFEHNFDNFFPKKIEPDVIKNYSYSGKSFRGKYFGFYHHDLRQNNVIMDFNRRINRLVKMLTNSKEKIVFIRTISSHNYNDEVELSERFLDVITLHYPSLKFILIFIIPEQQTTQYYKHLNEKIFMFTLKKGKFKIKLINEFTSIYHYILNNDLFTTIPKGNDIIIQDGYNRFVEVEGIPIVKTD
jgi:mRNA-degrading endonuclease HigB of HigAB toxin-antitoxin module